MTLSNDSSLYEGLLNYLERTLWAGQENVYGQTETILYVCTFDEHIIKIALGKEYPKITSN